MQHSSSSFRRASVFAALAAVLATFAQPVTAADDKVVAKVNDKVLTERDMKLAETEIGSDLGNIPAESRRRVLVEYLIENQLFADAAETEKLAATPAFENRMKYMRRRALREEFFETKIKTAVSEAVAKKFYDDQIKGMKQEEEVKARHILVETEEKARDIFEKISRGEDFAKMAQEHSRDPGTKGQGGLLGFFSKGQMVPQFEQAAFSLTPGDVSEPVQSRFGWHLIKLEERRKKPLPTFDDVRERILNSMILRRAQAEAETLRSKSKIEYVDEEIKKQVAEQSKQQDDQRKAIVDQLKKMHKDKDDKEGAAETGDKPKEPAAEEK